MLQRNPDDIRTLTPDVIHSADNMTIKSYSAPNAQGNIIYIGEAPPGTAKSDPFWRITKYFYNVDGSIDIRFSGGTLKFDYVWDNRETYQYG
ncbi:MAG: hypothetical protein H7839_19975 [Magnetococcus sp. YQC-5]